MHGAERCTPLPNPPPQWGRRSARLVDDRHDALELGRRLHALLALAQRPLAEQWPGGEDRRVAHVDLGVAGERERRGVLVPDLGLELVGVAHLEVQRALADL